jgi:acetyltransferase-like isoleucine patch superfamily enzyme
MIIREGLLFHLRRGDLSCFSMVKAFRLIGFIFGFISAFFPDSVFALIKVAKNSFHTVRYSRSFRFVGKKTIFQFRSRFFNPKFISIGENCFVGDFSLLEAPTFNYSKKAPCMKIGNGCVIGEFNHFTCTNEIVVGDNLLTGRFVLITDNSHGDTLKKNLIISPMCREVISSGPVVIGKNVWIGDKVSILPNVTIGDGVVIGANSVVTKDIPSYCVACGIPAKVIRNFGESRGAGVI